MEKSTAVIGAGPAGLACARTLADAGESVTLFDKGRAAGGRLATRRAEAEGRKLQFDHGAQYARVRDPGFAALMDQLVASGHAARWKVEGEGRVVGAPGMSALGRAMAAGLKLEANATVLRLESVVGGWQLHTAEGATHGPFAQVVLATPAPQAVPLLAPHSPAMAEAASATEAAPCWALMVAFEQKLPAIPDVLRARGEAIAWAARDSAKPGRETLAECFVVHAGPDYSRANLERAAPDMAPELLAEFAGLAGTSLPTPIHLAAHRWRYALVETPLGAPFLHDAARGLGACGDWCLGPRIESAWLSGVALGRALLT
jgi:predicted NAD/FAD-dependent oxidoreductase